MRITFNIGTTGLAPAFRTVNADGTEYATWSTEGVTESPAGSGGYGVNVADVTLAGRTVEWRTNEAMQRYGSESFPASIIPSSDIAMIRKVLTNRMVDNGATVDIYDDDNTTKLGTWTWTANTKTRGKLE